MKFKTLLTLFLFNLSMRKFLFGLLAGISAGILFAPESGKKLRDRLKKSDARASDFGKALLEAGKGASAEVRSVIATKEVQGWIESGQKSFSEFIRLAEEKAEILSERAKEEFNEVLGIALKKAESIKRDAKKTGKNAQKVIQKKVKTAKKTIEKMTK